MRFNRGNKNAKVFPEPVSACSIAVKPDVKGAIAACWIGVGSITPIASREFEIGCLNFTPANVMILFSFMGIETATKEDK